MSSHRSIKSDVVEVFVETVDEATEEATDVLRETIEGSVEAAGVIVEAIDGPSPRTNEFDDYRNVNLSQSVDLK